MNVTPPRCLGCDGVLPPPFLDFGPMPLANAFPRADEAGPDPLYPLAVCRCSACHLVQLADRVPPETLFREYLYFSSYSDTWLAHVREMAGALADRFGLGAGSSVLEIASNDGAFLQCFRGRGIRVLGVEPAGNVAAEAERRGVPTLCRFFSAEVVPEIVGSFGTADVVVGSNVLAHVPAVNGFLSSVRACLKPGGAAVFEFPSLLEMLAQNAFDTVYHEHVFYLSMTTVRTLAARAGLELFDASPLPVHGGSLRVFLQHPGQRPVAASVPGLLREEEEEGLTGPGRYEAFGRDVEALRRDLGARLRGLKAGGKRLAAYGAPAKGTVLLNACRIGRDLLDFAVDRSPVKQGRLVPGVRIPIRPPGDLLRDMPDVTLILPWNLAGEIVAQQQEYVRRGGRFLVPVPHPREVPG